MIDRYKWEIELNDSTIITEDNKINLDFNSVIRISYIPTILLFPRHDVILTDDNKFVKRFARSFLNFKGISKEYLHCVITSNFRFYLKSSDGGTLLTNKDFEFYI